MWVFKAARGVATVKPVPFRLCQVRVGYRCASTLDEANHEIARLQEEVQRLQGTENGPDSDGPIGGTLDHLKAEGDINLSDRRKEYQIRNLDERTKELLAEDAKYFLHQSLSTPCLNALQDCDGIYIKDLQGRRFMDFHGNSVHQIGFKNQVVIDAITKQMHDLPFCTRRYTNETAVALAKRLVNLAPDPLGKILFCPGGTSAVGMAMKLARMATGRHKTISMWDSFHGASLDCISIGGEQVFRGGIGPLLPGGVGMFFLLAISLASVSLCPLSRLIA